MADKTHEALREHMAKWREGDGFNANPLDELREQVLFLCARIDATREAIPGPEDVLDWSEGRLP